MANWKPLFLLLAGVNIASLSGAPPPQTGTPWDGASGLGIHLPRPGMTQRETPRHQRMGPGDRALMAERIATMKIWRLTEYLELSSTEGEKVFPRIRQHEEEMQAHRAAMRELVDQYLEDMEAAKLSPRDVDRFVEELSRLEKERIDLRARHITEMKDVMTEEQYAKFAVFEERFRRGLQMRLEEEMR